MKSLPGVTKIAVSTKFSRHRLLNPQFNWVPSEDTDLKATFERVRERLLKEPDATPAGERQTT